MFNQRETIAKRGGYGWLGVMAPTQPLLASTKPALAPKTLVLTGPTYAKAYFRIFLKFYRYKMVRGKSRDEQKNQRTEPEPEPPVPVSVLEFKIFQFLGQFSIPTFLKNLVLGSISSGFSSTGSRPMLILDKQKNQRTGSEPRTEPEPRKTKPEPEPLVPVLVLEFEIFRFLGRFSIPTFLKNSVLGSISSDSSSTSSKPMLIPREK
ncbi:hypothetical protein Tco_1438140 [Tanacetum coccineum]